MFKSIQKLLLIIAISAYTYGFDARVEELIDLASKNNVIHLKDNVEYFFKSYQREYSLLVFFKTSDLHPFYKSYISSELTKLSSAYNDAQNISTTKHKLFIIITEDTYFIAQNQKKLGLKFLPIIIFFPAFTDPTYKDVFDIRFNELVATYFARWVRSYIPVKVNIEAKINRGNAVVAIAVLFSLVFIGYMARNLISKFNTKNVWCLFVMLTVIIFLSGHMYNSINHVPEVNDEDQGISRYIGRGRRGQVGIETKMIGLLYTFGCIGFSLLNENWRFFSKGYLNKPTIRKFLGLFLIVSCAWCYNILNHLKMGFSLFPMILML